MNSQAAVTGIVLAGGASSRMGCDKALLTVGGQRLIARVIERLLPWVDRVMVVGHADNAARLQPFVTGEVVTDFVPGRGPLMGLYTGLMHSQTPLNLLVPCDMPRLDDRLVQRLFLAWRPGLALVAGAQPEGRLQPFPLLCHRSACRLIGALLDRRESALQQLRELPGADVIDLDDSVVPTNLNTPEDYERYRSALAR